MVMMPARIAALAALLLVPACSPGTTAEHAAHDQDLVRDIRVKLGEDPRFTGVVVLCRDRTVRLRGRVNDLDAARDCVRLARSSCPPGVHVIPELEVRPR